jgi:uncharacterized membrane protein
VPDLVLNGDEMANDVGWRPLTGGGRLRISRAGRCREAVWDRRDAVADIALRWCHSAIVSGLADRCDTRPMETGSAPDSPQQLSYNQIAARSLERIGALSDGLFAIAMTLIVLEIRIPEPTGVSTDGDLAQALLPLGPRFLTYLLSFLTLGIFWNGQQTQLSYFARGSRDLAWLSLLFLAIVALFPFTTSLLAEYFTFRLALGLYWLDILLCGLALLAIWTYAERAGLVRDDVGPEVGRAIRRRILVAQALYATGMVIGIIAGTLPATVFIVLVQLNFAIAPRIGILHRI